MKKILEPDFDAEGQFLQESLRSPDGELVASGSNATGSGGFTSDAKAAARTLAAGYSEDSVSEDTVDGESLGVILFRIELTLNPTADEQKFHIATSRTGTTFCSGARLLGSFLNRSGDDDQETETQIPIPRPAPPHSCSAARTSLQVRLPDAFAQAVPIESLGFTNFHIGTGGRDRNYRTRRDAAGRRDRWIPVPADLARDRAEAELPGPRRDRRSARADVLRPATRHHRRLRSRRQPHGCGRGRERRDEHLGSLDILSGRYWKVHREVDEHHLQLGLDRCGDVAPDSPAGIRYQRVLCHAADLHHQMLSSWVGEQAEPIATLWHESVSRITLQPSAGSRRSEHELVGSSHSRHRGIEVTASTRSAAISYSRYHSTRYRSMVNRSSRTVRSRARSPSESLGSPENQWV
ncbi:MAG TPA: hypothetical protein VF516_22835 [Kofleriaceae bacterium]